MFNLNGYKPKERFVTGKFVIRKLEATDVERDYATFIANADAIKAQRGGDWPSGSETLEEDRLDLGWHQREFEIGTSFAYQVMEPDEQEMIGCVYFYPPGHPNNAASVHEPKGIDASVNLWVTQPVFDSGLYNELYYFVQKWLVQWPFKNPYISNPLKPKTLDNQSPEQ